MLPKFCSSTSSSYMPTTSHRGIRLVAVIATSGHRTKVINVPERPDQEVETMPLPDYVDLRGSAFIAEQPTRDEFSNVDVLPRVPTSSHRWSVPCFKLSPDSHSHYFRSKTNILQLCAFPVGLDQPRTCVSGR